MNQVKYVYSQLTDFLPKRVFDCIVVKYNGNKHVRFFTCWNQLCSMIFGQLAGRESMRDLMIGLEAHKPKFYHLGFGSTVSRRNLGKANENRSYKIFEEFAYILIEEARKSCFKTDFEVEVDGNVYALDSTSLDLLAIAPQRYSAKTWSVAITFPVAPAPRGRAVANRV